MKKTLLRATCAILFAVGFAACSSLNADKSSSERKTFSAPAGLTATLTDSKRSNLKNIDLAWKNTATAPSGNFLEVDFNGNNEFVTLAILGSDITEFHHPDLVPDTQFIYRLHPFYGWESDLANVTTGDAPPQDLVVKEFDGPLQTKEMESPALNASKKSIQAAATAREAAPQHLTASLVASTRVVLKWEDRASDEDGYLIEGAPGPNGPFQVMALLPPDTTSFRQSGLPPHTKCYFRVRAFFYGKCSNFAVAKTPPQPSPAQLTNSR
jgi:hypothetical protein